MNYYRPIRELLIALALFLVGCGALTEAPPRAVPTAITPVTRATQEARAAQRTATARPAATAASASDEEPRGEAAILAAYEERVSGIIVEAEGTVRRLLADDNDGSRHQRFIVELPSGHTVLVAHNIDLAPRIDALERGDPVRFKGEYEWGDEGGVVHWTHHDPRGRHEGGFIEHEGIVYE